MSVRPPRSLSPRRALDEAPMQAALEHELFVERGETLVRVAKGFEKQLAALHAMADDDPRRADAVSKTARALWMLTVQREVIGLPGGEALFRAYDIPDDVRVASGVISRNLSKGHRMR